YLGMACGLFVDYQLATPDNPIVGGNYALKPSSPVINIGDNERYPGGSTALENELDVAGMPRLYGGTIDLGAYEFQGTPVSNTPPVANSVDVEGTLFVGDSLWGGYVFTDVDDDCEVATTFAWYRADDAD